jgi:hypothetical protein
MTTVSVSEDDRLGALKTGHLGFRGPMQELKLVGNGHLCLLNGLLTAAVKMNISDRKRVPLSGALLATLKAHKDLDFFVFAVQNMRILPLYLTSEESSNVDDHVANSSSQSSNIRMYGLILQPTTRQETEFVRVGSIRSFKV